MGEYDLYLYGIEGGLHDCAYELDRIYIQAFYGRESLGNLWAWLKDTWPGVYAAPLWTQPGGAGTKPYSIPDVLWSGNFYLSYISNALNIIAGSLAPAEPLDPAVWLGKAPLAGQPAQATYGGSMAQGQWNAALALLKNTGASPGPLDEAAAAVAGFIGTNLGRFLGWFGLDRPEASWNIISAFMGEGASDPEQVPVRAAKVLLATTAAGAAASGLADLSGLDVLGCWDVPLRSLAGFAGKLAGWDPIFNAIQQPLWDGYLRSPWERYVNSRLFPTNPGLGDVLRFRSKRLITDAEFELQMAYLGYHTGKWVPVYEKDLWAEPRQQELLTLAEDAGWTLPWLRKKAEALGYDDADVAMFLDGFPRRQSRTWINRLIAAELDAYADGYSNKDRMTERLTLAEIPQRVITWVAMTADAERTWRLVRDHVKLLEEEYSRGMVTDAELLGGYEAAGIAEADYIQRATLCKVRRYHKTYFLTITEVQKQKWTAAKTLFRCWKLTETDLHYIFVAGGMDPGVADWNVAAAAAARPVPKLAQPVQPVKPPGPTQTQARQYVIKGVYSTEDYRRLLAAQGWAGPALEAELALAEEMQRRALEQTTKPHSLATYEQAYILGLIDWVVVQTAMTDAGISLEEQEVRRLVVDYKRQQQLFTEAEQAEAAEAEALAGESIAAG